MQDLFGFEFDEDGHFTGDRSQWIEMPYVNVEVQGDFIYWKYGDDTWNIDLPENLQDWIETFDSSDPERGASVDPAVFTFAEDSVQQEMEQ